MANDCVKTAIRNTVNCNIVVPPPGLCLDNGAMTASAGYFRYRAGHVADMTLNANPNLRLSKELWKELERQ
jgi:N6-L-threonylcarbamoyladenine synthase